MGWESGGRAAEGVPLKENLVSDEETVPSLRLSEPAEEPGRANVFKVNPGGMWPDG